MIETFSGINIQKNLLNENVIQNKLFDTTFFTPLTLQFKRNLMVKVFQKVSFPSHHSNPLLGTSPTLLSIKPRDFSTQSWNVKRQGVWNNTNSHGRAIQPNLAQDPNSSEEAAIPTICFSTYTKRFLSSIRSSETVLSQDHSSIGPWVQVQSTCGYSTIPEAPPTPNPTPEQNHQESDHSDHHTNHKDTNNEKEKNDFVTLMKKYGVIAVGVYFTLTCTIYLTTLGIILYYDIDPDELTKKSKTFITKTVKRILGRVETIEDTIEEAKKRRHAHKENQTPLLEGQEGEGKEGEEGEPVNKKKKLIKTMIMTYAVTQVFSPPKSMLTVIITPYVAKILKKGF